MRSSIALLALVGWLASHSLTAIAIEPVNPFAQPDPINRGVSANISDDPQSDSAVQEKPGFSFPKLSLPKLPKPSLPKFEMPKMQMPKVTLPKISMPQWTKREPSPNQGPSTWEKLNNNTKSMMTKTRDTLMPWAAKDEPPPARSVTGSRSSTGMSRSRVASNRGGSESSAEKKSLFGSLFSSSESDEKPIETTNDFLSQRRPRFD